ncbi:MAG: dihydroorotate dehydrogenase [Gemmatimonadota bacterium]|nr:MAG: dihydroorotate dehydrogenase [Gemmatimonadota bacterium]
MSVDLSVKVSAIRLRNPVLVASGTFGYGEEYADHIDVRKLGGIVTKSISLHPRPGNPPPRIAETPCGMLNAIGLANVGVHRFIEEKLPFLRSLDVPIIVNIACSTVSEYAEVAAILSECDGLAGIEINISCPNVEREGMAFGSDPSTAHTVVAAVRQATHLPVIAKLTPNVTDIVTIAQSVVDAGADAISLINTLVGMSIDINSRRPKLANITGGLSGPAIRPVALALVWKIVRLGTVPVIGVGGITTTEDALEFFIAGATAIQIGTGNFVDPRTPLRIIEELKTFLEEEGLESISELIGSLTIEP